MIYQKMAEYKCNPPVKLKVDVERIKQDINFGRLGIKLLIDTVTIDKIHELKDITYYHVVELDYWYNSVYFEIKGISDFKDVEVRKW